MLMVKSDDYEAAYMLAVSRCVARERARKSHHRAFDAAAQADLKVQAEWLKSNGTGKAYAIAYDVSLRKTAVLRAARQAWVDAIKASQEANRLIDAMETVGAGA